MLPKLEAITNSNESGGWETKPANKLTPKLCRHTSLIPCRASSGIQLIKINGSNCWTQPICGLDECMNIDLTHYNLYYIIVSSLQINFKPKHRITIDLIIWISTVGR